MGKVGRPLETCCLGQNEYNPQMDPNEITMAAFRMAGIHFAISKEQSLNQTTLDHLTERIRQVQTGIKPEMEFATAIN